MVRIAHSIGLLVLSAVLAGCGATRLNETASFSPEADNALVVVGVKLDLGYVNRLKYNTPRVQLTWVKYDRPNNNFYALTNFVRAETEPCFSPEGLCSGEDTFYFALETPPGDYLLGEVAIRPCGDGCPSTVVRGILLGGTNAVRYEAFHTYRFVPLTIGDAESPSAFRTHTFNVKPGELVYIGTFVIGGSISAAEIDEIVVDLPAARQHLQGFPNVTGALVVREPSDGDGWTPPDLIWTGFRQY